MAKHEDNAIIFLLCIVVGICMVVMFFLLLQLMTVDKQLIHHKREVERVIVMLREEREKLKSKEKDE